MPHLYSSYTEIKLNSKLNKNIHRANKVQVKYTNVTDDVASLKMELLRKFE